MATLDEAMAVHAKATEDRTMQDWQILADYEMAAVGMHDAHVWEWIRSQFVPEGIEPMPYERHIYTEA